MAGLAATFATKLRQRGADLESKASKGPRAARKVNVAWRHRASCTSPQHTLHPLRRRSPIYTLQIVTVTRWWLLRDLAGLWELLPAGNLRRRRKHRHATEQSSTAISSEPPTEGLQHGPHLLLHLLHLLPKIAVRSPSVNRKGTQTSVRRQQKRSQNATRTEAFGPEPRHSHAHWHGRCAQDICLDILCSTSRLCSSLTGH